MTHDGYHAISIAPGHHEVRRAFTDALQNAGVAPEEIAYMNAHGPGHQAVRHHRGGGVRRSVPAAPRGSSR